MSRYCPKCAKVFPGEEVPCPECGGTTRDNHSLPSLKLVSQASFNLETEEYELERMLEVIEGEGEDSDEH